METPFPIIVEEQSFERESPNAWEAERGFRGSGMMKPSRG
jgi:hypothetical protein